MELDELFALLETDHGKMTHTALQKPAGPYDTKMMAKTPCGPEIGVPDESGGGSGDD